MKNVSPFYQAENCLGVLFDGSCAFTLCNTTLEKDDETITAPSLQIRALKEKKTPVENLQYSLDDVDMNADFINLVFTSSKSIDVLINSLNELKKYY